MTNTFYGTWLPGDPRGSVTSVRDRRPEDPGGESRFEHDLPGTHWEPAISGIYRSAQEQMKGPPILMTTEMAVVLLNQMQETAAYREHFLLAVAIMIDHLHFVVQFPNDPDPHRILADYKAYGSRALNRRFGKPTSGSWWTSKGSVRIKRDPDAIRAAIRYVLQKQPNPIVTWSPTGEPGA